MNEFMDALADGLEQEGHFELYRGGHGDLRTSAKVWLREDERDVIVEALRKSAATPSDRPADVTKLLEFVVRADSDNTWSSNRRAIVGDARALLSAFTVGRR